MEIGLRVDLKTAEGARRQAAIEALHEHGPMLLAAARVITLDDDEAQDLVQTTFEIALRHVDALREPAALRSWLLRIEAREAMRVVRRLRRIVRIGDSVREIRAPVSDPAQRADMRQALQMLPLRIRATIVLHHLGGLSVRETADALGVSENTIKSELKTGLARLREALRDG